MEVEHRVTQVPFAVFENGDQYPKIAYFLMKYDPKEMKAAFAIDR